MVSNRAVLKVGLTGNIASGKSSVARIWRTQGAIVSDADELARKAVRPGADALRQIVGVWGEGVLDPDGTLNRAALRDIVFRDPGERARLEAIVHPAVGALREAAYRDAVERGESLVVADIPLLYEAGLESEFDVVVLVHAPEEVRLSRLVHDRGLDPEGAQRMISAQMPSEHKRARADVVIENSGSKEDLEVRALEVWQDLARHARSRSYRGSR